MVLFRYLTLSTAMLFSLFFGAQSDAMQWPYAYNAHESEQSEITIEPYQHDRDYADLYRLFNENNNNLGEWGYNDTFPQNDQIKVARWHDQLAGFVIYSQKENEGYISYVVVDQKIRNNGLGKILLNEAMSDLKYQGADSVSLNVYEHNTKAQSLYQRLGFYLQSANDGLMNYALRFA